MSGSIHQPEPDKQETKITSVDTHNLSLTEVEGPARTLTDHERLVLLAELNGLTKEEALGKANFDKSGRVTALDLSDADVKDLSPLAALTELTHLDLSRTKINDVAPLSKFTALTQLDLRYTEVSDLSPLVGCTELTYLNLAGTKVSDL